MTHCRMIVPLVHWPSGNETTAIQGNQKYVYMLTCIGKICALTFQVIISANLQPECRNIGAASLENCIGIGNRNLDEIRISYAKILLCWSWINDSPT